MTEYVILEKTNDDAWAKVSVMKARSSSSAIRLLLDGENGTAGEYVAIPARSFHPVKVQVETKTQLKFS